MGVISVLSNAYPCEVLKITNAFWSGDTDTSLVLQRELYQKARALFKETNPTPVKYVMSLLGYCSDEVRLPLSRASESTKRTLEKEFDLTDR